MPSSTGNIAAVAPYSGAMFDSVARSGTVSAESPSPKNSTNLPTTPWRRSSSVSVSTRSVAVDAGAQPAAELDADHDRRAAARAARRAARPRPRCRRRPSRACRARRSSSCASRCRRACRARPPCRRVLAQLHHAGEVLQVDLVARCPCRAARRGTSRTRPAPSAAARSARRCARTRARCCARTRSACRSASTCTEWSITRSAGTSGSTRAGVAAGARHGAAHRGEVDDRGHAGEVLEDDARRAGTAPRCPPAPGPARTRARARRPRRRGCPRRCAGGSRAAPARCTEGGWCWRRRPRRARRAGSTRSPDGRSAGPWRRTGRSARCPRAHHASPCRFWRIVRRRRSIGIWLWSAVSHQASDGRAGHRPAPAG